MPDDFKHCDDYIDDPTAPAALRAFLKHNRSPGHGHSLGPSPKLFATYTGKGWKDVATGDRVRVVMASRMGDVGVTKNMDATHGYSARFDIASLADFSDTPCVSDAAIYDHAVDCAWHDGESECDCYYSAEHECVINAVNPCDNCRRLEAEEAEAEARDRSAGVLAPQK